MKFSRERVTRLSKCDWLLQSAGIAQVAGQFAKQTKESGGRRRGPRNTLDKFNRLWETCKAEERKVRITRCHPRIGLGKEKGSLTGSKGYGGVGARI